MKQIFIIILNLLIKSIQGDWNHQEFTKEYDTLMVVELVRHGARASVISGLENVKAGQLTPKGRIEMMNLGL